MYEVPEEVSALAKHFMEVDELTHVVIKAHLFIEERLNNLLRHIVYNPETIETVDLTFRHKLDLVNAFCMSPQRVGMFDLLKSLNSLRNAIAHSLDNDRRHKQFAKMKDLYLRELGDPDAVAKDREAPDHYLVMMVTAYCDGFLRAMTKDAVVKGNIDRRFVAKVRELLANTD